MSKAQAVIAATIIIDDQGRYLLVQESRKDIYSQWGFPGGHVDEGETKQIAAIRETKEEVDLKVKLLTDEPVYEALTTDGHPYSAYRAEIVAGVVNTAEDILDAIWFSSQEIKELNNAGKLRDPLISRAIQKVEADGLRK